MSTALRRPTPRPKPGAARPNVPTPPKPLSRSEINDHLAYTCARLIERCNELVQAMREVATAYPTIDDDEALGIAAENMRMAQALRKSSEDTRKAEKDPFLVGGRTVDAWFASFLQPLTDACDPVQKAMNAYGQRKLEAQRAAAEAERKRAAEEAQRQAERAAQRMTDEALTTAAEAAKEADRAEARALARPAALTRTRGDYGAVASVRSSWGWEVVDEAAIPREFFTLDPDKVKLAAKDRDPSGKPVAEIPGLRWVEKSVMGVR
jgi:hypothetical protein